ncbi:unnamed protein product [Lupinus luteus]|uniref:Uncharacterized protein n=1 Tax=Lupinus luteus TaxID=3873 RepID=A0AAV1W0W6_LUPLU
MAFLSFYPFREYTFSDMRYLEHRAKLLNQSLMTFGFLTCLDFFANGPMRIDLYFLSEKMKR